MLYADIITREKNFIPDRNDLQGKRVLVVDLNNFARYPTLAIGYLVAPLRQSGCDIRVFSPLTFGAPAFEREKKETWTEHVKRIFYFSRNRLLLTLREPLRRRLSASAEKPHANTITALRSYLEGESFDAILLSAYLTHRPSVEHIARLASQKNIPVLLGGPAFNQPKVSEDWIKIAGVTAIFGGECDRVICDVVSETIHKGDLARFAGLYTPATERFMPAAPLAELDSLPVPDFTDFPWHRYPHKVIPVMTARGCAWGVCTFCSDVVTANGRGFRSRSPEVVLAELVTLSERHDCKDFIFLDLKLNSDLRVWRTLIERFQSAIPGARWIATVHVDGKGENGLSREELFKAKAAGLVRMSFGLETGSQRLNTLMAKGTTMERNAQFVRDAADAGISLRASMMLGYPGETATDVELSADFLEAHKRDFDRIRLSLFKAIPGTRFAESYEKKKERFSDIDNLIWDHRYNRAIYDDTSPDSRAYRKAKNRLLRLIHEINRKPLRDNMQQFDGLM